MAWHAQKKKKQITSSNQTPTDDRAPKQSIMECLLWCFVALFVSVRLITRKTDFRLTRIYGGSSERSKSQSRKHQLQVRWGELKPAESRFFFLSFPFPLFLFLKTDERKARYRMFNEGKGWWAVLASQYANEMVSDALLYSGGYEWRPLLQNYYDNWGVFGGGAKLKVTLKHSPPPKCCFLQSVASHPDRNANFLSLREDEEIHNISRRQWGRDVTAECDDHISGSCYISSALWDWDGALQTLLATCQDHNRKQLLQTPQRQPEVLILQSNSQKTTIATCCLRHWSMTSSEKASYGWLLQHWCVQTIQNWTKKNFL